MKIRVNAREYCRYEAGRETIHVTLTELTPGDSILITLERVDTGRVCREIGPFTPATATFDAMFDLRTLADDGINYVRFGAHEVLVYDPDGEEVGRSRQFWIGPFTVDAFKNSHLFGIPLHATDVLMPIAQPSAVTGVHIDYVDPYMLKGAGVLAYVAVGKLLIWRGGPSVTITGTEIQTLQLLTPAADAYLEVTVDPELLPTTDTNEQIIIDNQRYTDAIMRRTLEESVGAITREMRCLLEPHIITTEPNDPEPYDLLVDALPREPNQIATIQFPGTRCRPLLKVERLEGWYNAQKALTIPSQWFAIEEKAGYVTMLPIAGAASVQQSVGLVPFPWLGRIGPTNYIADFWHYRIVAGMRDLEHSRFSIREAIGRYAAVTILENLSIAASGGRQSRSVQRDGVSENWSYGQGAYQEKISGYKEWLKVELPRIRRFHSGMDVVVL